MKEALDRAGDRSRRELRRHERRNLILDVAQQTFLENGYSGTTMSAIAAKLGGSKGTLWHHFSSKETLFTSVLDRSAEQFRQGLMEMLNPDTALETALRSFCRKYIGILCTPLVIETHRLVIAEAKRFPELGVMFFDHAIGVTRAILCDFITQAATKKLLDVSDPATAASLLTSLCHGRCFQQLIFGLVEAVSEDEIDRDAELALKTFVNTFLHEKTNDSS